MRKYTTNFLLTLLVVLILCGQAGALSLFSIFKKEPYVAKVGDRVITTERFVEEVKRLHTLNRVGKKLAESEDKSFRKQNYRKFLEELIDRELMLMEAENLGLHKDPTFLEAMRVFKLNLFLDRLRKEEVLKKVKVTEEDVLEYYRKKMKKGDRDKPTQEERYTIERALYAEKLKEREKEYFKSLRRKARIETYEDVLKALTKDSIKKDAHKKVVARVDDKPIYAIELLRELERMKKYDMETKKKALDNLILRALLDKEALSRGYERDPELKKKIELYRRKILVEVFKDRVILPLIKVNEEEIEEYYKKNKEKYKEPDKYNISVIAVGNRELADSILKELERGGDFEYLAKEHSVDPSRIRGGLVGWVSERNLPRKALALIKKAKKGDVVGPVENRRLFIIYKINDYREGKPLPLEKVKREIDITIGRKKFKETLELYLKRLRKIVKVEINEEELARFY